MTELAQIECWLSNQARKSILLESAREEKGEEQDGVNSCTSGLLPIQPTSQDPLLPNKPTKGEDRKKETYSLGPYGDEGPQQLLQVCLQEST